MGTTQLTFIDDGSSCEYADAQYNPLPDIPTSEYYINGLVQPAPAVWTGAVSSVWYVEANWQSGVVPDSNTDVIIPGTGVTHWPVYTGEFTVGIQCKNITLEGPAQMTVSGGER